MLFRSVSFSVICRDESGQVLILRHTWQVSLCLALALFNNYITKWRLGAWDVQRPQLEVGKPTPGPSSTPMAGHSRNPAMRKHAWRLSTRHTDKQWKKIGRGRGEASQLGGAAQENLQDLQPVQPCD